MVMVRDMVKVMVRDVIKVMVRDMVILSENKLIAGRITFF